MKKLLFLQLICLIYFSSYAQDKWDLKRCVEYALANNISVKQADVQARITELTLKQSKLSQLPTASVSANGGVRSGRSIDPTSNQFTTQQLFFFNPGFSTGVNVFNFFNIKNTIAGNEFDYAASRAYVDKLKNDIALNVATAYLLVLVSKEQANIAQVTVQQSQQNFDNTKKRVDAGSMPELNLAETEAQLARDSSTLVTAQSTFLQNILQLKAVMNLDAAQSFEIAMPPLDQIPVENLSDLQPEVVYNIALTNQPLQKVNRLKVKAAEKYVDAAHGALYPSLTVFGGLSSSYANNKIPNYQVVPTGNYQNSGAKVNVGGTDYVVLAPVTNTLVTTSTTPLFTQMNDNFSQNIGLSLNIPLLNGGIARTNLQRNKLNVENLQLQQQQDDMQLKQNIYKAYTDATAALEKFNASKKSLITAQKTFDFSQKRYDVGLLATIDYLTNQNNLTTAKFNLSSAHVDFVFKMKVLEFYKGLGIKL